MLGVNRCRRCRPTPCHRCSSIAAATAFGARTVIENRTSWSRHGVMTLFDQNAESARKMLGPVAPARRTRRIVSRTNRCAPRALFADPVASGRAGSRRCPHRSPTAGGSPRAGVAERRACLACPWTSQIVESVSMTSGTASGLAQAALVIVNSRSVSVSRWRTRPTGTGAATCPRWTAPHFMTGDLAARARAPRPPTRGGVVDGA